MGSKLAEATQFTALQRRRAVGNPDAFPLQIHLTGRGVASGFLRTSTREKRPVEDGQFRVPGWIRNGDGKQTGIFVIHISEFDALIRAEVGEPEALPVEEVLRYGQGDPRTSDRKCRVSHQVAPQWFHKRDPRILAAALAAGLQLIVGFRFQRDAKPLDACRIAGIVESHSCNADA